MFDEVVGLLKPGTIVGFNKEKNTIQVKLNTSQVIKGQKSLPIDVPVPYSLFYNNGLFMGSNPKYGTPVVVGQGSGNQYYFVSFLPENKNLVPEIKDDLLLIKSSDNAKIELDLNSNINIGSDTSKIHINTGSKLNQKTNLISFSFNNENHFTEASRNINGVIKRDLVFNTNFDQNTKLKNDDYDSKYKVIGLDPTATANDLSYGSNKNPPLVELREIVYEFQSQSNVGSDIEESLQYSGSNKSNKKFDLPNRRKSRADTLSLTLLEPNFLMESIKGTVVDIFGNILDLNRYPLPVGKDQDTLRSDKTSDKLAAFKKIKELERKSLAFHFEINAKKDLNVDNSNKSTLDLLDINSNKDNSRIRSRFFFDVDKEGQFKLNVPASSEKGNIPLLTRYENYSSFGSEDDNNPNKLIYRNDNLDIFLDSFAAPDTTLKDKGMVYSKERGVIQILNDVGENAPIDRITQSHIKHGTAHHNILNTCLTSQNNLYLNYQKGTVDPLTIDIDSIPILENIVSKTIITSGPNANAGGRSGSFNFDGSIDLNLGANTVDRQSLWLDFAGGIVGNIGRDKNLRSAVLNMDGDFILQVGGFGVSGDSRFEKLQNGAVGSVLDIRVFGAGGYVHMIRCDKNGITVMTPGNIAMHASGGIKISTDSNMSLEAENMFLQGRMVLKESGGSI